MKTLKEELREWLRPVSPLTAFAKSLKNEDDPTKAAKGQFIDPMADEDLSELPTSVQEKLKKMKEDYEVSFKKNQELEERRIKAEEFARTQQSKADRASAVLRQHNLDPATPPAKSNSADAKHDELVAKFVKDGLTPELAQTYAKMFASNNELQRKQLLEEVAGPLATNINSLKAQSALLQVQGEFKNVFAIPEIAQQIEANVTGLLNAGTQVTKETITHLTKMAWGEYTLDPKNANALKKEKDDITVLPQFKSSVSNGGHINNPRKEEGDGPKASQPETIKVVSELQKQWQSDMPKKGKK